MNQLLRGNMTVKGEMNFPLVAANAFDSAFSDLDLELDPLTGEIVKKEAEVVTVY
ncbi:hypothetical protein [Bacillus sp. UMB0893]|uniref:hypothetical protein n=1 Tax=Bacillus sp. UMB0893 TaxID=2066053 RepID=UPI0015DF70AC|nr:hypothetical protein [Bacillus sp. UMB0893]